MSSAEYLCVEAKNEAMQGELDRLRELLLDSEHKARLYEAFYLATINKQGFPLRKRAEMLRQAKLAIEQIR